MRFLRIAVAAVILTAGAVVMTSVAQTTVGREVAIPTHMQDGEEYTKSAVQLLEFGKKLFRANWTVQEGAGRPNVNGTGAPLADPTQPLVSARAFNRVSAPDSNSCAGCHNAPFGLAGGGGDFVTNVFVLAQRFDFATFDRDDWFRLRGAVDERLQPVTLQSIGNLRSTLGMFGAGYIEMLAREMTADLQAIRNRIPLGGSVPLNTKGVSFGVLTRRLDGTWDTSNVQGLSALSLAGSPPTLTIRPFSQAGNVISLRQFTVNAFNQHHGIQATERVGSGADPDGDGFVNEMTRADVTAASVFQATMAVPGRVIPRDSTIEAAVALGEQRFALIGCGSCHKPTLPLTNWIFTEPNPYNPPGTLRPGEAQPVSVDLNSALLPLPRLTPSQGVIAVPAFTDLKLHDLTDGPEDSNAEPLDMNQAAGSDAFFAGNRKFLTRKLWGVANEPPYFHHGRFTTLREAILAHGGEAAAVRASFLALLPAEQDAIVEFLKTLQVLPPGTPYLLIDDHGLPRLDIPLKLPLL